MGHAWSFSWHASSLQRCLMRGLRGRRGFGCCRLRDVRRSCPWPGQRACRCRRQAAAGPKPGMAAGSVKSHWFSAIPMKSRIAGSDVQARRKAALVSSAGTPDCRKARMSVPAVMESIGGKLAGSNGGGEGEFAGVLQLPLDRRERFSIRSADSGSPTSGFSCLAFSRFRRDQRATKFSGSLIARSPAHRSRPRRLGSSRSRWRLKNGRSTWCSAMNCRNRLGDGLRHRHGVDQIVACLRVGLAFGRVSRNSEYLVGRLGTRSAAAPPRAGAPRTADWSEVVRRLRSIQLDGGGAGIERWWRRRPAPAASRALPRARLPTPKRAARRSPTRAGRLVAARPRRRREC